MLLHVRLCEHAFYGQLYIVPLIPSQVRSCLNGALSTVTSGYVRHSLLVLSFAGAVGAEESSVFHMEQHQHRPASVAWLIEHSSTELRIVGSILGRGRQQCSRGKHCKQVLSSVRDAKPLAVCVKVSAHGKESSGEQSYLQSYTAASLMIIVAL